MLLQNYNNNNNNIHLPSCGSVTATVDGNWNIIFLYNKYIEQ